MIRMLIHYNTKYISIAGMIFVCERGMDINSKTSPDVRSKVE